MQWTNTRLAILTQRWNEGASPSEIAKELGPEVTRNMVARTRERIGLPPRSGAVLQAALAHRGRACGTGLKASLVRHPTPPAQLLADEAPLAGSEPRAWTDRLIGECCFPVAGQGADTFSCCLPVAGPGASYCTAHAMATSRPAPLDSRPARFQRAGLEASSSGQTRYGVP